MSEDINLNIRDFPCDLCGADLTFHPGQACLKCSHCGAEKEIDGHDRERSQDALSELDYRAAIARGLDAQETQDCRVHSCENCGAQIEFTHAARARSCPYCATPYVDNQAQNTRGIKARGLAPFLIDGNAAQSALEAWLKSLWFAPNGVAEFARKSRKPEGVYMPFWTYDAQTKTRYEGQRGTVYYVNKTVRVVVDGKARSQTKRVQKIRWRRASGRVQRFFDDIIIRASHALPKSRMEGLEPWDLGQLTPYNPEYLAGYNSEVYSISLEEGMREAREKMNAVIKRDIRFDIGGDRQRITHMETELSDISFKHILLPLWSAAYKFRGKTYRVLINGQSGAITGDRPYSVAKIILAAFLGIIVAVVVGYFLAQNDIGPSAF